MYVIFMFILIKIMYNLFDVLVMKIITTAIKYSFLLLLLLLPWFRPFKTIPLNKHTATYLYPLLLPANESSALLFQRLSTQSSHLKRGLPRGLLPTGFSSITLLINESCFLQACPAQTSLLFFISFSISGS
jgi:hypothetical protein